MTDFVLINHGTVCRIVAKSESAKEFAAENFGVESWQGSPVNFCTDTRVAFQLCERLASEGWVVQ